MGFNCSINSVEKIHIKASAYTVIAGSPVGYKKLVDEVDRKTLGNLLRQVRKVAEFDHRQKK